MVMDSGNLAPYAPLAPVVALIRRRREKTLPEVLNAEKLAQMSVSEGNISRVLQALRFLSLIDEEGRQTEGFTRIARAKEQEYPDILAEIIKGSYHDVFTIIDDPNQATDIELNDAFRFYQPQSQRNRMIILFRGLCQEAGLIKGGPPATRTRARTTTSGKLSHALSNGVKKVHPKSEEFQQEHILPPTQHTRQTATTSSSQELVILQGLLNQLPFVEKRWTHPRRDKWVQAMTSMVDFLFEVEDPEEGMYSE